MERMLMRGGLGNLTLLDFSLSLLSLNNGWLLQLNILLWEIKSLGTNREKCILRECDSNSAKQVIDICSDKADWQWQLAIINGTKMKQQTQNRWSETTHVIHNTVGKPKIQQLRGEQSWQKKALPHLTFQDHLWSNKTVAIYEWLTRIRTTTALWSYDVKSAGKLKTHAISNDYFDGIKVYANNLGTGDACFSCYWNMSGK